VPTNFNEAHDDEGASDATLYIAGANSRRHEFSTESENAPRFDYQTGGGASK
jgi:hypothetical protein